MKPSELKNKVAFVTGASKGLGKAMALALAQAGAKVALVSRDEKRLTQAAGSTSASPSPISRWENGTASRPPTSPARS